MALQFAAAVELDFLVCDVLGVGLVWATVVAASSRTAADVKRRIRLFLGKTTERTSQSRSFDHGSVTIAPVRNQRWFVAIAGSGGPLHRLLLRLQ